MAEHENYFLLLEIPLKPESNNPTVIEKAIKDKQREWSRLRNHPSKGRQAQKNLATLKKIKSLMKDDQKRDQEFQNALKIKNSENREKYEKLDRIISMASSKGEILESELQQIYQSFPEFSKSEINQRAKNKTKIVKDSAGQKQDNTRLKMDDKDFIPRSIMDKIDEALKIIGKKDLYNFLGVSTNAPLVKLQKITDEKYIQNNKIASKTAEVTATSELLGHCSTIFKTENSKKRYDETSSYRKLSKLDPYINIAGVDQTIEYTEFQHLLEEAKRLSIDSLTLKKYLREYSKNFGWELKLSNVNSSQSSTRSTSNFKIDKDIKISEQKFLEAAKNGDTGKVEIFLNKGGDVNYQNKDGNTALILAAFYGHFKTVKVLIDFGGDPNLSSNSGVTPLIWVANQNKVPIARFLLDNGAKIDQKDQNGYSPLIWSASRGNIEMVKLLLEKGADINLKNNRDQTAYQVAKNEGYHNIADLLVKSVTKKSNSSNNANFEMLKAAKEGDLANLNTLFYRNINLNFQNDEGETALILAIKNDHNSIAKTFITKGANINLGDKYGYTPLIHAILKNDLAIISELDKKRVNFNKGDNGGYTPFMHAIGVGDDILIKFLLTKRIDLDQKADDGNSALSIAVWQGKEDIVRLLINKGADINVTTKSGKNLYQLAKDRGYRSLINYFAPHFPEPIVEKVVEPIKKEIYKEEPRNNFSEKKVDKKIDTEIKKEVNNIVEPTDQKEVKKVKPKTTKKDKVEDINRENQESKNKKDEKNDKKKPWWKFW